MAIRLGGYARRKKSGWSESATRKIGILAAILVVHLALLVWWGTRSDAQQRATVMVEVVTHYFDIAPLPAAGGAEAEPQTR